MKSARKNIIEIGERLEHVAFRLHNEGHSIDEITNITYLPEEVVQKSIDEYSKQAECTAYNNND